MADAEDEGDWDTRAKQQFAYMADFAKSTNGWRPLKGSSAEPKRLEVKRPSWLPAQPGAPNRSEEESRSAEQAAALDDAKKQIAELQQQLDQLKTQLNRDAQETGPVADPQLPGDAAAVLADFYRKYPERPRGEFRPVIPYGP
jgi:hypothetical protein